jgi:hypothetical protein
MQATLNRQTHQALFNPNLVSFHFADVDILYIAGSATCNVCMWGYMESSRRYKEALKRGQKVRPTTFKIVEGGNHFVSGISSLSESSTQIIKLHYDMPGVLLREVAHGCKKF